MKNVLKFIMETFDLNVLALFLISGIFLLYFDSNEYKKNNLMKEYRFSMFFGYLYIVIGIVMFVIARYIRL